jgi:hypothetical protein
MSTLAQLRSLARAEPVYLLQITLKNSGPTLYFSDRRIKVEGIEYEDYIDALDGLGSVHERSTSQGMNSAVSIKFKNSAYGASDYLIELGSTYPFEGALVLIQEAMLDVSGQPSVGEDVFKGVLESPHAIDLLGFICRASSVEFYSDITQ